MSKTQVITKTQTPLKLDLAELKTVKWIGSNYAVRQTYEVTSETYKRLRLVTILSWMLAPIEFMVISFYLFIHSLPWPDWFLQILFRIDRMIENILEEISRKVEWWLDVIMIRCMRLWESMETFFDKLLSLAVYVLLKVYDIWLWYIGITLRIIAFWLSPIIWIIKSILPPEKIPPQNPSLSDTNSAIEASDRKLGDKEINQEARTEKENRSRDTEEDEERPTNSSEYESDVSVLSENWSIGHTNKAGKYYNRVEMTATAEGKLRAAMYKRVKAQLSVMRKNSIVFSRGMTAYVRNVLNPRVRPYVSSIESWLLRLAEKYDVLGYYEAFTEWLIAHPRAAKLYNDVLSIFNRVIEILNKYFGPKRKSRRTRSMRSESLRKKNLAVSAEPIGLGQSAEPVQDEEFCNLPETSLKDENDSDQSGARDSALASSLDELCPTSDSNEGSRCLIGQPIEEEEEEKLKEEKLKEESEKNLKEIRRVAETGQKAKKDTTKMHREDKELKDDRKRRVNKVIVPKTENCEREKSGNSLYVTANGKQSLSTKSSLSNRGERKSSLTPTDQSPDKSSTDGSTESSPKIGKDPQRRISFTL